MMGDDGEKFGAWPSTWEHCWGEGRWVERFFEALEANADWLSTTTPSAWLAEHHPIGRVYIPTGSYAEMGEWALPADESVGYARAFHHARDQGLPEARWLRGAFWRNFQVKYREINDLHKQMLRVSAAVDAMPPGPDRDTALDHLFQGQSNDCYWHGLFGGIYISHMRLATFEHLIAAEDLADTRAGTLEAAESRDLDMDGVDEIRLADAGQVVSVDLDGGAGIGSWDIRAVRHALTAVMRRRPEAYHTTLRAHADAPVGAIVGGSGSDANEATSIHDTFRVKEPGLVAHLVYDAYERRSGLVRVLPLDATSTDWAMARAGELGDAVDGAFERVELGPGCLVARRRGTIAGATVDVTKSLTLGGDRRSPTLALELRLEHVAGPAVDARIGVEWSTTMLGGGGNPAAWWEIRGDRAGHDVAGAASGLSTIAQGNDFIGIVLTTTIDAAADAWWAPIETVSNSEDGFERVYQGAGLLLSWPTRLAPGATWTRTIGQAVTTDRDRASTAS
jgi:alpha-amylase